MRGKPHREVKPEGNGQGKNSSHLKVGEGMRGREDLLVNVRLTRLALVNQPITSLSSPCRVSFSPRKYTQQSLPHLLCVFLGIIPYGKEYQLKRTVYLPICLFRNVTVSLGLLYFLSMKDTSIYLHDSVCAWTSESTWSCACLSAANVRKTV